MAWKRFVAAGDVHGCEQDSEACRAFFRFMDDWKPTIRIFLGDLFDLKALRKKASEEERRSSIAEDRQMGIEWITQFKPTVFHDGNHDARIYDLAEDGVGLYKDYAMECVSQFEEVLRKLGCGPHLPYDRRLGIYELGKLRTFHGFSFGVSAARKHAQTYGNCLFGHTHTPQRHAIEGLEPRVGIGAGCLCNLNMKFERAAIRTLTHNHGWISGVINDRSGAFHLWPVERINDKFVYVSDFKEI